MKKYPKVLIIGEPFDKVSGYGITISNLFHGWPKDKIAVASKSNLRENADFSVCELYYQLGYNNKLHPFPFNILLNKVECGQVSISGKRTGMGKEPPRRAKKRFRKMYVIINALLSFFGIHPFFYKLKLTKDFKDWLNNYGPDIIYSHLMTLEMIRFVDKVQKYTQKPLAIHIADEWTKFIYNSSLFYPYWQKVIDKELRSLFDRSTVLMSICRAMSDEYKGRYKKDFLPFHNPIIIDNWLPYSKKSWEIKDTFKILYAGRLGLGNRKTILDIAAIIEKLNKDNYNIIFDIFTRDIDSTNLELFKGFKNTCLKYNQAHYEMPRVLPKYDLLILPLDFDKKELQYSRLSMPTKMSEYMISGTPVLVYADKNSALAKFALQEQCAYTVTENNHYILHDAIVELYGNQYLRGKLGARAKEVAINNNDAEVVREDFRRAMVSGHTLYAKNNKYKSGRTIRLVS
ncbi:hypothetical protein MNBD_BACTEROID01-1648 [hydrothermal vent metagenome]|uniref:Uncharacterized protein n=1 Tax=hydrothermal vent metagenome TaxID=652676 RepID=A0A3B0ULW6_9ZZZZ